MNNNITNELNRAVILLNFEKENISTAKSVLVKQYKIPQAYLSMLIHKIFYRLGTYNFNRNAHTNSSLWNQFHLIATEEIKLLGINH